MRSAFKKFGEGEIAELGQKYCKHPGCPVIAAVIKGVEAAAEWLCLKMRRLPSKRNST